FTRSTLSNFTRSALMNASSIVVRAMLCFLAWLRVIARVCLSAGRAGPRGQTSRFCPGGFLDLPRFSVSAAGAAGLVQHQGPRPLSSRFATADRDWRGLRGSVRQTARASHGRRRRRGLLVAADAEGVHTAKPVGDADAVDQQQTKDQQGRQVENA